MNLTLSSTPELSGEHYVHRLLPWVVLGLLSAASLLGFLGTTFGAEKISSARYEDPVERYGHFALGRPHEYARLTVTTSTGRKLTLALPENEVFEDLAPRLVRLAPAEPDEILSIVSRHDSGARLVLFRLLGDGLVFSAQSAAIGTPMRWLNPVGVADLDGDGQAEIAAVITPHIGGTLKIYRREGRELIEIAALPGFSNHAYRSPELALSTPVSIDGRMRLLVPDVPRLNLRIIALQGNRLVEIGRCALVSPITGAISEVSPRELTVGVRSGQQVVNPGDCRN